MKVTWMLYTSAVILSTNAIAQNVTITGSIPIDVSNYSYGESERNSNKNIVILQKIELSKNAIDFLKKRHLKLHDSKVSDKAFLENHKNLPKKYFVGMNGVPVLNQGAHGSCVTFANTAALDAIIHKGDYISQLCSLELGQYLEEKNLIEYSGWNGSFGPVVLKQLEDYGVFSKAYQLEYGCAGVKEYPLYDPFNQGAPMSIEDYTYRSVPLAQYAQWHSIVDTEGAFSRQFNPEKVLWSVKKSLSEKNLVTFGVLLDIDAGHVGALGSFKKPFDTWVLTPKIVEHLQQGLIEAGHEMVIIGYDDNAVVTDNTGAKSRGILTLRNSWGKNAGNNGNYYMSYDYFKVLVDEVQLIKSTG